MMEPLSTKIAVSIDASYADQDYGALASQLLSQPRFNELGNLIAICWHHGNIPSLIHALDAKLGSFPDPWDASVFNQILILSYSGERARNLTSVTEPF